MPPLEAEFAFQLSCPPPGVTSEDPQSSVAVGRDLNWDVEVQQPHPFENRTPPGRVIIGHFGFGQANGSILRHRPTVEGYRRGGSQPSPVR